MKKKKKGKIITIDVRLEGFVDWVDPNTSDLAEEREDNMSSLGVGFSAQIRKRAASAQEETTPSFEVYGGKHPKRSGPNKEAQESRAVITLDSPERASDVVPTLEGTTQEAYREACALLEDGSIAQGPPSVDKVGGRRCSFKSSHWPIVPG